MWSRIKLLFGIKANAPQEPAADLTLHLPLDPIPENAPKLAQLVVDTAFRLDGVSLDYSPESLAFVDSRVPAFREQGSTRTQVAETLFLFGCYFGEVLRRHLGGQWFTPAQHPAGFALLALNLGHELHANPIGKVFKLFDNGQEDSVAWLYKVLAEEMAKRTAAPGDA